MPRLPPRSSRQIEQLLAHFGFRFDRAGKSGHDLWAPPLPGRSVAIPRNRRSGEISDGTVMAVLREARITRAQALKFWGIR
jgi:predicted RNA binding protein YcfA (HicA-like mRNA interferase family)